MLYDRRVGILCVQTGSDPCNAFFKKLGFLGTFDYRESYPFDFTPDTPTAYAMYGEDMENVDRDWYSGMFYIYCRPGVFFADINLDNINRYDRYGDISECNIYPTIEEIKKTEQYDTSRHKERMTYICTDYDGV